jgi:5-methylcytosine-specific restriction protein A
MNGEVDHITPLAKGGTDEDDNLQLLCLACHEKKTRIENGYRERKEIGLDGWPVA